MNATYLHNGLKQDLPSCTSQELQEQYSLVLAPAYCVTYALFRSKQSKARREVANYLDSRAHLQGGGGYGICQTNFTSTKFFKQIYF